ncbi:MAG: hypothetical protein ACYDHW_03950 [Syntrophorhabdaceae bacterium]
MDAQKLHNREEDNMVEKDIIRFTTDRLPHYGWLFADTPMSDSRGGSRREE